MGNLYIPNSIALRNFDSLFKNNNFDFGDGGVDISFHPQYVAMHPIALAFYAAMADYFRSKNVKIRAGINYQIRSIPYLQRMGLFRVLGFANPVPTKEHEETGRFIPLKKITSNSELDEFIKTIDPILHTTRQNSRVIKHVFSELLRNVLEHSGAKYGGNVCATYNRKRQKIAIGISDSGVGLYENLKIHHKISNCREAVIAALKPGISGTTPRIGGTTENAGAGLFFTKSIAKSTRNHFLIYSGDTYFKLNLTTAGRQILFEPDPLQDKHTMKEKLPYFQGTLIGIDVHISDDAVFENLISQIGSAYRLSVKKNTKDYFKRIRFT